MHGSASQAFKIITSKIHPQLPLSPRESEQLLRLLTTSFRQHLDREHPVKTTSSATRNDLPSQSERPSAPRSSFSTADRHIESILTNPLFAIRPQRPQSHGHQAHNLAETQLFFKDPLGWFEQQVAVGTASITKARFCLERLSSITRPGHKSHSDAGQKVLTLLWSSGAATSKEFLTNLRFVQLLAGFLTAGNHHDVLWRWFNEAPSELKTKFDVDDRTINRWKGTILRTMLRHDLSESPEVAMSRFAAVIASQPATADMRMTFSSAGKLLVDYASRPAEPSAFTAATYEKFISQVEKWTNHAKLIQGLLWLHHPTQPDLSRALDFVRGFKQSNVPSKPKLRNKTIRLFLATAEKLIEQGRHEEAQWVLVHAQQLFTELGTPKESHPRESKEPSAVSKDEAENLESLDALSLA